MPRRRERRCLRFYQRGRYRWVELITESEPAGTPQTITVAGRSVDAFDARRFRTSALSAPPRIICFEEVGDAPESPSASAPTAPVRRKRSESERSAHIREAIERIRALPPDKQHALAVAEAEELSQPSPVVHATHADPWAGLAAFKDRVLRDLPALLHRLASRPTTRQVEPFPPIEVQKGLRAFIDVPLPPPAADALAFLDDLAAVHQAGDDAALDRVTDRLLPRWRPSNDPEVRAALRHQVKVERKRQTEIKRQALMAGIVLAAESARIPQIVRLGDSTTLRDDDDLTADAVPEHLVFPYYHWFVTKEAFRIAATELVADAPEIQPVDADAVRLLVVQEATAEPIHALAEMLAVFSPEQRRIARRALSDSVPLAEAARRLNIPPGTASTQISRMRRKLAPFRKTR